MAVNTGLGAKVYISNAAVLESVDTGAEYAALTWVEIGEAESLGDFGDESAGVSFTSMSSARVRNLKGARDAGNVALVVGHDPLDTGQLKLIEAEASRYNYAFKVVVPDAPAATYNDSIHYFRGMVMSKRMGGLQTNDITKRTFNIGINSPITEVVAALIPSP